MGIFYQIFVDPWTATVARLATGISSYATRGCAIHPFFMLMTAQPFFVASSWSA